MLIRILGTNKFNKDLGDNFGKVYQGYMAPFVLSDSMEPVIQLFRSDKQLDAKVSGILKIPTGTITASLAVAEMAYDLLSDAQKQGVYELTRDRLKQQDPTLSNHRRFKPESFYRVAKVFAQGVNPDRFIREIRTTYFRLNHPNIAITTEYGIYTPKSQNKIPFFVMEHAPSIDLNKVQLPPQDVVDIGIAVSAALAYAHKREIVHRDVKPDNIRFIPGHTIKVIDFGMGKDYLTPDQVKSMDGTLMGGLGFIPPPSDGTFEGDSKNDVYGLGATLYFMLTQNYAVQIDRDNYLEAIHRLYDPRARRPVSEFNPDISPKLEELVMSTLEIVPECRPTAAQSNESLIEIRDKELILR